MTTKAQKANRTISDPDELWAELEKFPAAPLAYDHYNRRFAGNQWVFRGVANAEYRLEPTIERVAKDLEWKAHEVLISKAFKARARMHLEPGLIPGSEIAWLALMQHYGVPTRLLDFSYFPYIALYFAVRPQTCASCQSNRENVRLWALNATDINSKFDQSVASGKGEARTRAGRPRGKIVSLHSDDMGTQGDFVQIEMKREQEVEKPLSATGTLRAKLEKSGGVAVTPAPEHNPRLAHQQGVFLINSAEQLTLEDSLNKMMAKKSSAQKTDHWRRIIDIDAKLVEDIERRLFKLNIHEESLFPDLEGLSKGIRQKIRLRVR